MIYTVTLNPSLDYVVRVSDFEPGNLHRTTEEEIYVGGKGLNVTVVLKRLGVESLSLGFVAGFTGREIEHRLKRMGIAADFVTASQGRSRINIKLKSNQAPETEINGQGPVIGSHEMELLYQKLGRLNDGDILVLSGSVPRQTKSSRHSDEDNQYTNRDDTYAELCGRVAGKGLRLVIDAEGKLLRNALKYKPFLIKPNHLELGRLFGRKLTDEESIIECAGQLQQEGAQNVLVSMAEKGAILLDSEGRITRQRAPQGRVVNSVGAGDALVAGFLYGLLLDKKEQGEEYSLEDYQRALRFSVACGSAAAFTEGYPAKEQVEELYRSL